MKVKYNKNGTVSIIGMDETLYYAIQNIIRSAEVSFNEPEENGDYYSNDFVCSLSPQEKEALDRAGWDI